MIRPDYYTLWKTALKPSLPLKDHWNFVKFRLTQLTHFATGGYACKRGIHIKYLKMCNIRQRLMGPRKPHYTLKDCWKTETLYAILAVDLHGGCVGWNKKNACNLT